MKQLSEQAKQERAKQRISELKGFYVHLMVYLLINVFFMLNVIIRDYYNGNSVLDSLFSLEVYSLWFFWGIGIFFHAVHVFQWNPFFNRKWEERQLKKIMEKEERRIQRFKNNI